MKKKSEYKSAVRSRKKIKQALADLLREKDPEEITVTEIVERAGLNRGTFYAHYNNTRSVIEQIENEIIDKMVEFLGEGKYQNFFQDPLPFFNRVSRYLKENIEFYRILISAKGSEQFLSKLKKIFVEKIITENAIPKNVKESTDFIVRAHFFAGGIANIYQSWFRGEIDCSLDDLAKALSKIVTNRTDNVSVSNQK